MPRDVTPQPFRKGTAVDQNSSSSAVQKTDSRRTRSQLPTDPSGLLDRPPPRLAEHQILVPLSGGSLNGHAWRRARETGFGAGTAEQFGIRQRKFVQPSEPAAVESAVVEKAVEAGHTLSELKQRFQVTSPSGIRELEFLLVAKGTPAELLVLSDRSVPEVAKAIGISTPPPERLANSPLEALEFLAIGPGGAAARAVDNGGSPDVVADCHGLISEKVRKQFKVGRAAAKYYSVDANKGRLTDFDGPAYKMIDEGFSVDRVLETCNFSSGPRPFTREDQVLLESKRLLLEMRAANEGGPAWNLAKKTGDHKEAARRFGITAKHLVERLEAASVPPRSSARPSQSKPERRSTRKPPIAPRRRTDSAIELAKLGTRLTEYSLNTFPPDDYENQLDILVSLRREVLKFPENDQSSELMKEIEATAMQPEGLAMTMLARGLTIPYIVGRLLIKEKSHLQRLEACAVLDTNPAWQEARETGNATAVAKRYGVKTPFRVKELERAARLGEQDKASASGSSGISDSSCASTSSPSSPTCSRLF